MAVCNVAAAATAVRRLSHKEEKKNRQINICYSESEFIWH